MNEQNSVNNSPIINSLEDEIEIYKKGQMQFRTFQFQLFVMCAHEIILKKSFYDMSIPQINEYLRTVKFFTISEVEIIVRMLVSHSSTINEANSLIKKILPSVRCLYKQGKNKYYLSPCCCENLYNNLTDKKYKLKNGENYTLRTLFDFQSDKMTKIRLSQEKYSNPPQFQHHENTGFAYEHHNFRKIYNRPIQKDENSPIFEKDVEIPPNWNNNIFTAAERTDTKTIRYLIFLIPELRNLQDEHGRTVAHYAAKYGDVQTIYTLYKLNTNFNIYDEDGFLPIHLAKNKEAVEALVLNGCDFEALTKNGQSLVELNSNPFNKYTVEFLIRKGFNILKPNEKGVYWAQMVANKNYFKAYVPNKDYEEFQAFIINSFSRSIIKQYKDNKAFQKLISRRPSEISLNEDINELKKAVNERDMDKIKAYAAIGTPLDNLMSAAKNNDMELVKLLAGNFCSPNSKNANGETVFWVAAYNNLFDISTLLSKEYNADLNVKKNGLTLMHVAYNEKRYDLVYYLLDLGASPNIEDSYNETVQIKAFLDGNNEMGEIIQDYYGGDINRIGKDGCPLGNSILKKYGIERLIYLVNRKLNIELKDNSKCTVFMELITSSNDISALQCLIDHGADVNTKDDEGYTPFFYVCNDGNFSREKFDLLLKNHCDINIKNELREFPISELIDHGLTDEVLLLLEKYHPIINDCESKHEPIVVALQENNKIVVDKLAECGANALNKQISVVERYLEKSFFNFETLKKLKKYNLAIGTPLQNAIRRNKRDVAIYIWQNTTDKEMRIQASKSLDEFHHTPLMLAIYKNDEYFMNQLIQPGFDLATPDNDGKTPLIHFYEKEMYEWVNKIMPLLTIEEISAYDSREYGALTYITKMENKELVEELFLKGVNVFNVRYYNDMLKKYVLILNRRTDLHNIVTNEMNRLIKITNYDYKDPDSKYQKLSRIQKKIDEASRRDLLYNMEYFEKLVKDNI